MPKFGNDAASGSVRFRRRRRSQTLVFGLFFNLRPTLTLPLGNGVLVTFQSSSGGALATPAELPQKAPYMSGVIVNSTFLFDQIRYPRRGPQSGVITERFRSTLQSALDPLQIFGAQAWFPSGSTGLLQTQTAFFFQLLCPTTDRLAMHTDLSRDFRLTEAFFE